MTEYKKYATFTGKLWMVGFGTIASGTLPLILRHVNIEPEQIEIFTMFPDDSGCAEHYGVKLNILPITPENYREVLTIKEGDCMIQLANDVGSVDLMEYCDEMGCLYVDTVVEPWPGGYYSGSLSDRTNYIMREKVIELKKQYQEDGKEHPTLISCFGANPGIVSCFLKKALIDVARDTGVNVDEKPTTREDWAKLAQTLGVKVIHIAERDDQVHINPKKPMEFVNTWSAFGFIAEGSQPAELGWGTHEPRLPADGCEHDGGCGAAIFLSRPGMSTKVRTWTPNEGNFHGFLITHNESISIADYYTVRDDDGKAVYRPTSHYAYHPCDSAVMSIHELGGKNFDFSDVTMRVLVDEITEGMDELGVLVCGHEKNAYWYGSQLSIQQARDAAPYVSATSLQVCTAVLSAFIVAVNDPKRGILEADDLDYEAVLEISEPYLGTMVGEYTDWNPLESRPNLGFPIHDIFDPENVWSFTNVRVHL